jgi:hypothetical protein
MDKQTLERAAMSLIITLLGYELGCIYAGAVGAIFLFIGIELTHASYRWVGVYTRGSKINTPWYGPFSRSIWDNRSILNVVIPIVIVIPCLIVYYLMTEGII